MREPKYCHICLAGLMLITIPIINLNISTTTHIIIKTYIFSSLCKCLVESCQVFLLILNVSLYHCCNFGFMQPRVRRNIKSKFGYQIKKNSPRIFTYLKPLQNHLIIVDSLRRNISKKKKITYEELYDPDFHNPATHNISYTIC